MKPFQVNLEDIKKARSVIEKFVGVTPLEHNSFLSKRYECNVFLKLETMHPIGSFKIRGATYRISQLPSAQMKKGVIAASAGNHAQGVAWGAKQFNVAAEIVMPINASLVKIQNTKELGASVALEGRNLDEAIAFAKEKAKKTGQTFIHAYEDPMIIAGQGTTGLEILEQCKDVDTIIGPIGGGGLMTGVSVATKALLPKCKTVGAQTAGAPSMVKSLREGKAVDGGDLKTFSDGIAIKAASEKVRSVLSEHIDETYLVHEEDIAEAVLVLMEKARVVAEGSGAVPLAALDHIGPSVKGKNVVLIISGGNIDVTLISRIIERGLIRNGRRLRINILMSDAPGTLSRLTSKISDLGGNIVQVIHDRSEAWTMIDQTGVALTLETKGAEHSSEILRALESMDQTIFNVEPY